MKILLVISGSIAAYKSLDLIRKLQENNHTVTGIISKSGEKFVTQLSVASLSGNYAYTDADFFNIHNSMHHISLTRNSDILLVAPATLDIIAKTAHGIADELATTVLIASNIPIIMAPAMNPVMWYSKANQRNIKCLRNDNVVIIEPKEGLAVCNEYGLGKMAETQDIVSFIDNFQKT
ncbi:phosphopantothenoylcysteine decarboxylase [Ehrlichia canis]|uniref:Phosphopantothenoyl cysteine decarboxylase n=1 Tax=Ehrlichia canis (strain Jake) TaxID=269484 RepID=A0ACA6AV14_EHRCJ|nr:phosphopantothenoylcysteine decarboxylase [Ehrlichia canis]AAZ68084.1 Phosphopantothenoyl cysteine decarboxylase [Ehrlichia canis str. Jake]AUO54340.1 phosphopantothenoylcysteine decarboxylase [Ehrlichia canis]UKC53648.1 phosphopantothenoylcysteine decarboxylase [Ehrlichia canis]UKC54586.1 phosphopantothenoylcysteine decarboxylase [Ehrlichia canis]UKC55522.1 phosphopantothenoylcysteine decarboxylase [Ehrlichia canis]